MKKSNLFVGSVVSAGVAAFAVAALTFGGTSTTALAAPGVPMASPSSPSNPSNPSGPGSSGGQQQHAGGNTATNSNANNGGNNNGGRNNGGRNNGGSNNGGHLPHALEEALVVVHTHQVAMVVQRALAQVDLRQSAQQMLTMELLGFSTARVGGSRTLMVHTL